MASNATSNAPDPSAPEPGVPKPGDKGSRSPTPETTSAADAASSGDAASTAGNLTKKQSPKGFGVCKYE